MRKPYVILFALVVLLSTAMSVQALESKTIERHNGASASASWDETNGDTTTSTYISVTKAITELTFTWRSIQGARLLV